MQDLDFFLLEKNKSIYKSLPEEYANFILNSILARAIQRGDLQEELELYFNVDEISDILYKNEIRIKQKRGGPKIKEEKTNLFSEENINSKSEVEDSNEQKTLLKSSGAKAFTL